MDFARRDEAAVTTTHTADAEAGAITPVPLFGIDERRMHVRAYNYWVSLLDGAVFPHIDSLAVAGEGDFGSDFGDHAVLMDFSADPAQPAITRIGAKLRGECQLPDGPVELAQVPSRSLLSRLTEHHLEIVANRAPVGFEAEFVNERGNNTLYRGILMPFTRGGEAVDFVLGVINWKEVVDATEAAGIVVEMVRAEPAALAAVADAPVVEVDENAALPAPVGAVAVTEDDAAVDVLPEVEAGAGLADLLAGARACAEQLRSADGRSRAALYRALALAHDFALVAETHATDYRELLEDAGVKAQARAPMTPIVKLVFGADYDKTRLTEFAAALSYARRKVLPAGGMQPFLEQYPGGLKAIVAAERRERRPAPAAAGQEPWRVAAHELPVQARLALAGDDEFVVLVARRTSPDEVGVIGVAPEDKALLARAMRALG